MIFGKKRPRRRKKPSSRAPRSGGSRSTASGPRHASSGVSPRAHATVRRAPRNSSYGRKRRSGWMGRIDWWTIFFRVSIISVAIGGLTFAYFALTLPDITLLEKVKKEQGITVTTADGRVIGTYGDVYGTYVPYDKLPKHLVQAVIATEDRRFFAHHGVDFFGIARAMLVNTMHGRVVQGGSTITQQVAKNVFLTPKRSLQRKIQEVLLAFWLESRYTKQEIIAIYLNRVYMGGGTYGVDAAARRYFNKSAVDLGLVESATIAGLLKAPSRFSPTADRERSQKRAHQVLLNMVDAGFLPVSAVNVSLDTFAKQEPQSVEGNDIRYFTDWVVDQLPNYVSGVEDDIVVTTTLATSLQEYAQDALENMLDTEGGAKRVSQGAVVAMTPDGAVKAMVGGLSYAKSQYNRAAQARRQPGSIFKLFVYLAALEAGYTPQSTVLDAPLTIKVGNKYWSPENFTTSYKGEIPMVQALRESLNTVSVRLSQYTGVSRVAQMAMRLGIPNVPANPSIALGAVEATLVEMTGAFAHLAHNGLKVEPYGILEIKTLKGEELYKREERPAEPVLAKGTVEMMNYMLLDVVRRGTATRARLPGRDAAGKTGTSQDFKDAWFVGFTPQLVAGVWVGNDDNKPMLKVTGGSLPAAIWRDFMVHAMEGIPVQGIPNKPGSREGLLPWLFGGEGNSEMQNMAPMDPNLAPVDAPGGRFTAEVPQPGMYPPAGSYPSAPASPPQAAQQDEVLTPGFWNQLMRENVPSLPKGRVEYEYPSDDGRR